jgi:hypothetical protein
VKSENNEGLNVNSKTGSGLVNTLEIARSAIITNKNGESDGWCKGNRWKSGISKCIGLASTCGNC